MTWGAINEWTTQGGYARLSARAGHPVLTELLGRIMKQEGRHIDFYVSEAHLRLDRLPDQEGLGLAIKALEHHRAGAEPARRHPSGVELSTAA